MGNKNAKYATNAAVAAIIINFIAGLGPVFGFIGMIAALFGFILSIKGIIDYNKDKTIGGLGWCILALIISLLMIFDAGIKILRFIF